MGTDALLEQDRSLRAWFHDRLGTILRRRAIRAAAATEHYLVELLAGFARRTLTFLHEPLVFQFRDALEARGPERLARFRALGDGALYTAGFLQPHLEAKGISPAYVAAFGARGYRQAEGLARPRVDPRGETYGALAAEFETYAGALDELREQTSLRTPQDLVRLYERYRRTGSPTLAARLQEEGVYPQLASSRWLQ